MSNFISLKKKEKNWTVQCLIFNHEKKRKKLDIAMSNFISLNKTEKNWTLQCLILYH